MAEQYAARWSSNTQRGRTDVSVSFVPLDSHDEDLGRDGAYRDQELSSIDAS
jgi:hypothetical protein